jgi:hypothetical protein
MNKIGIAQTKLVVTAVDVHAFSVEHRAHRAIEDVNAIGIENVSERFHL